jgi:hypothetical protein
LNRLAARGTTPHRRRGGRGVEFYSACISPVNTHADACGRAPENKAREVDRDPAGRTSAVQGTRVRDTSPPACLLCSSLIVRMANRVKATEGGNDLADFGRFVSDVSFS